MDKEQRPGLQAAELEKKEPLPGEYEVSVTFKRRSGEDFEIKFDDIISLNEGEDYEALKKRALGEATAMGLHNFGMDVYAGRYPDGHPVKFTLKHSSGQEFSFTQRFDASGYAVQEK